MTIQDKIAQIEGILAEMKKENPAPCPLEEGQAVVFNLSPEVGKWLGGYYFGCDLTVKEGDGLYIRIGGVGADFGRKILAKAGEKVD